MTETFDSKSIRGTHAFGRRLAERLGAGDLVALEGDLGAGKTVLVRGIAEGLGVTGPRAVTSPTFVLVQEYAGRIPIFHIDLYRLAEPGGELAQLGLDEMLSAGVVLIEWADRAGDALPRPHWRIRIEATGPKARRFVLDRVA